MNNQELYNKYDLLLPSKYDGGYLIIAIDEKIRSGDLEAFFTPKEIDDTLTEISVQFKQDSVPQWSRIKDNLLHYFIRNHAEEPGKYYLTEYAKEVLDMMRNKLENPYKSHPLKESFERSFFLRSNEIACIEDLERKFGRLFISGPKKIITDHLEGLEDELREAYRKLNILLDNDMQEAVSLVKEFALTFRQFGVRAEDITEAMQSKDKFLRDLSMVVDNFYSEVEVARLSNNNELKQNKIDDWKKSQEIYGDISEFFSSVDNKIKASRRQIYNASDKLSELQEYFSTRSSYRLQIQKLLAFVLQTSSYSEDGVVFKNNFPLKEFVFEQSKMLYLKHYEFSRKNPNIIETVPPDEEYEQEERSKIEKEINRQQVINEWVEKAKEKLNSQKQLLLKEFMDEILTDGADLSIAYGVASEMIAFVSETDHVHINITQEPLRLETNEIVLWKTKISI